MQCDHCGRDHLLVRSRLFRKSSRQPEPDAGHFGARLRQQRHDQCHRCWWQSHAELSDPGRPEECDMRSGLLAWMIRRVQSGKDDGVALISVVMFLLVAGALTTAVTVLAVNNLQNSGRDR